MSRLPTVEECEEEHFWDLEVNLNGSATYKKRESSPKVHKECSAMLNSSEARYIYDEVHHEVKHRHGDLVNNLYETSDVRDGESCQGDGQRGCVSKKMNVESWHRMDDTDSLRGIEHGGFANEELTITPHSALTSRSSLTLPTPTGKYQDTTVSMRGGTGPGCTSALDHLFRPDRKPRPPQPPPHNPTSTRGQGCYSHSSGQDNQDFEGRGVPEGPLESNNLARGDPLVSARFLPRSLAVQRRMSAEHDVRIIRDALPPPVPTKSPRRQPIVPQHSQDEYDLFGFAAPAPIQGTPLGSRTVDQVVGNTKTKAAQFLNTLPAPYEIADPDVATSYPESGPWDVQSNVSTGYLAITQVLEGKEREGRHERDEEASAQGIKNDYRRKLCKINCEEMAEENVIQYDESRTEKEKHGAIQRIADLSIGRMEEPAEATGDNIFDDSDARREISRYVPGTSHLHGDNTQPIHQPVERQQSTVAVLGKGIGKVMRLLLAVPNDPELKSYSRRKPPPPRTHAILSPIGTNPARSQSPHISPHSVSAELSKLNSRPSRGDKVKRPKRPSTAPADTTGQSAEQAYVERQRRMVREISQQFSGATLKDESDRPSRQVSANVRTARGRESDISSNATRWPTQSEIYSGGVRDTRDMV